MFLLEWAEISGAYSAETKNFNCKASIQSSRLMSVSTHGADVGYIKLYSENNEHVLGLM